MSSMRDRSRLVLQEPEKTVEMQLTESLYAQQAPFRTGVPAVREIGNPAFWAPSSIQISPAAPNTSIVFWFAHTVYLLLVYKCMDMVLWHKRNHRIRQREWKLWRGADFGCDLIYESVHIWREWKKPICISKAFQIHVPSLSLSLSVSQCLTRPRVQWASFANLNKFLQIGSYRLTNYCSDICARDACLIAVLVLGFFSCSRPVRTESIEILD